VSFEDEKSRSGNADIIGIDNISRAIFEMFGSRSCWISALWHFVTPRRTGDIEV
jgi:hypothetical protein